MSGATPPGRLSTGINGLDEILHGGLIPDRSYLVRGRAGTGKTTLSYHFLTAGRAAGEPVLFVSLGEQEDRVRQNIDSIGLDLGEMVILDLSPRPEFFAQGRSYDLFSPGDVERDPTTRKIVEAVETYKPRRVVLDATMQLRYLTPDLLHFRRQLLAFLHFIVGRGATVLFTSEPSRSHPDDDLRSLSDGTIRLGLDASGRSITVDKLRGSDFAPGPHSLRITDQGMKVFPRLRPPVESAQPDQVTSDPLPSGVGELDTFLHGGIERGSVALLTGPSGTGKTTVGLSFMKEAARRGEGSVVFVFDESIPALTRRCEALGIPIRAMVEQGTLDLIPADPLRHSADELASFVRREVEQQGATTLMIDSITGYALAKRRVSLIDDLYALCKYLTRMGITTLLVDETRQVAGALRPGAVGIDFMADKILFFRYMERHSANDTVELRKAIGILKKRSSSFETTLRELEFGREGIRIGPPMPHLKGIVSRMPVVRSDESSDPPE